MATADKPKNQNPEGLGNLGQIPSTATATLCRDLLNELEMAHRIIRNGLSLMSAAQKNAWSRKNDNDGLIEFGTTRANERGDLITRATHQLNRKEF